MTKSNMMYKACKFIQDDDKNSDIMDCYHEYMDDDMQRNTLIEILQDRFEDCRQDFMNDEKKDQYLKYTKWLGI